MGHVHALHGAPDDPSLEPDADDLDLGELGHAAA
jgi:hypothetical protein